MSNEPQNLNVVTVTVAQAIDAIVHAPANRFIVLAGAPGSGKSAAIIEATRILKGRYWPLYLATKEAVEMNGLPGFVERDGKRRGAWTPFEHVLPLADDGYDGLIVVNLDDYGHAAPSVRKAALRCVYGDGSERVMGSHKLYDNVRIVATTNWHTQRAGVHRFETYESNRVTVLHVEQSADDWVSWALAHGVNPIIAAFVKQNKQVTDFAPDKDAFMSARSLESLSDFVNAFEKAGINGPILRATAYGTIGAQAGSAFLAYHALAAELPDMDAVLAGKQVKLPERPEVQYMFITTLIRAAESKHVPIVASLVQKLTESGGTGFEVAAFLTLECLKGSATKLRGLASQPALYKWLSEYGKYLP